MKAPENHSINTMLANVNARLQSEPAFTLYEAYTDLHNAIREYALRANFIVFKAGDRQIDYDVFDPSVSDRFGWEQSHRGKEPPTWGE
jgi:hypothetical protein